MAEVIDHPAALSSIGVDGLPHNSEIECALLGSILLDNAAYHRVAHFLKGEHFYQPVHGRIFDAAAKLIDGGRTAAPPVLIPLFADDPELKAAGAAKYIAALVPQAIVPASAEDYGRHVFELHERRILIATCGAVAEDARDHDTSTADLLEYLDGQLYPLSVGGGASPVRGVHVFLDSALDLAEQAYQRAGTISGVTTGLQKLDSQTSGLQPGELIVLAGRPSMGKSDAAINILHNAARAMPEGESALMFSLEMPGEMVSQRLLAKMSGVSAYAQRSGTIVQSDFDRLVAARGHLASLPIIIDDFGSPNLSHIRGVCRRHNRRGGRLGLIVLDYLQRMPWPTGRRDENTALGEITRSLKDIALEMKCPVLLVSQLSRAVESREDKRPQMSDLRGSGSIEQDADVVIFVYRDEYYLSRTEPPDQSTDAWAKWAAKMERARGRMDLIVAKQRCGPEGFVRVGYSGAGSSLTDLDAQGAGQ